MPWHYLNCGDPTLCDATVQSLLTTYNSMVRDEQLPPDAAIYSRHESRGDLHCELILYFNPDATAVARVAGAMACNEPLPDGLSPMIPNNPM
ncbi:MAG: hypothetical protein KDI33_09250 [Halioglobus sp.]|nr:hypothetical protein [Halioglobus sp.]